MSFRDLYLQAKAKPTQVQIFVKGIADLTKCSESTVRMWATGRQVPDALRKSVLSEKLGIAPEDLFPKREIQQL